MQSARPSFEISEVYIRLHRIRDYKTIACGLWPVISSFIKIRVLHRNSVAQNCVQLVSNCAELCGIALNCRGFTGLAIAFYTFYCDVREQLSFCENNSKGCKLVNKTR